MDEPNRPLIGAIREALVAVRDPANAAPMQSDMKSTLPYLGIKTP